MAERGHLIIISGMSGVMSVVIGETHGAWLYLSGTQFSCLIGGPHRDTLLTSSARKASEYGAEPLSFYRRSRRYHPDSASGNEETFISIRRAYEVLSDPTKRWAYDR